MSDFTSSDLNYVNTNSLSDPEIVLNRETLVHQKPYKFIKRSFDILMSLIGLIVLIPLFFVVGLLIWLRDFGPIFYSQVRIGENGQEFKMYKLRSMVVDADQKLHDLLAQNDIEGAMFKMKDDPRITKIGRFIRKYSIDELPQLWNVLRGDMSLVGPRPPLPREVAKYTSYDRQRLYVKPGCTGLWQISGRNNVGFKEMVELDLEYIDNRSVWFDVKLIFKTIWVMIHPNGAY